MSSTAPWIDEPICMIDVADDNKIYYYHFDGLGSVVALTDTSGTFVEYYDYDVFGEPTIWDVTDIYNPVIVDSSVIGNPYMFTGRRFDTETGLYYHRVRCYDPEIGRFLQTDPIYYEDGLNLYTYCGNNPTNFVDPTGKWGGSWLTAGFGALIGATSGFTGSLAYEAVDWVFGGDFDTSNIAAWTGAGAATGALIGGVAGNLIGDPSFTVVVGAAALGGGTGAGAGLLKHTIFNGDETEVWDVEPVEPPTLSDDGDGPVKKGL